MDISTADNSINTYTKLSGKEKRKQIEEILGEKAKKFSISMSNGIPILCHKEYGLFTGEWTCDVFQTDFRAQTDGLTSRVIRGGGAYFWPWQDQEWVWCMSAMRMPSSDLVDNQCAFRLVFEI